MGDSREVTLNPKYVTEEFAEALRDALQTLLAERREVAQGLAYERVEANEETGEPGSL